MATRIQVTVSAIADDERAAAMREAHLHDGIVPCDTINPGATHWAVAAFGRDGDGPWKAELRAVTVLRGGPLAPGGRLRCFPAAVTSATLRLQVVGTGMVSRYERRPDGTYGFAGEVPLDDCDFPGGFSDDD